NLVQQLGVMREYFTGKPKDADLGRYNVTKQDADRFVFRVPSLRNVGLTAPYFHDGSAQTLEDAVDIMADVQLGQPLTPRENALIAGFLKTLTGDQPSDPRSRSGAEIDGKPL